MEKTVGFIRKTLIVGVNSEIGKALLNIYHKNDYDCIGTFNKNKPDIDTKNKCIALLECNLKTMSGIENLLEFSDKFQPHNIIYLPGYIDGKNLSNNTLKDIHETFNANIFAFWLLISRTSCYMKKSKYGRFLSLSSIGSKFGGGIDRYNYTSSKKLLEFFPKDLKDLAKNNIFINNIICGVTDTPILRKKKNESINKRINLIPVGRLASPSEIAQCCFNTCSENNTFQTLSNITIAGGE